MAENYKETEEEIGSRNESVERDAESYPSRAAYDDRPSPYVYYHGYRRSTAHRLLFYLLNILEVLLGLRFLLKLLGANPANGFVSFIYNLTNPFIAPFRGVFAPATSNGTVIEWATIIAMIVYALLVYAIVRLVDIVTNPAR